MRPSIARGATTMSAGGAFTGFGLLLSASFTSGLPPPAGPKSKPSTTVELAALEAIALPAVPMPHSGHAVAGFSLKSTAPLLSRTSSMNHDVTRKPPFANAEKPRATDRGVSDAVPSDIDRFGGRS